MDKRTKVYLRESQEKVDVNITNDSMPIISDEIIAKWQRIINIMAKIIDVPAGLIMQITEKSMVVFLKSQNEKNPYPVGGSDTLGHGLYCETVIGEDSELHVPNALENEVWSDNPDVKLNMISYYGLPIHWPNKEFFGTICVLDNKKNEYGEKYKSLLKEFKEAIEADLKNLVYEDRLKYFAQIDLLTSSFNRNNIERILDNKFKKYKESDETFSIVIMDIDNLKKINDEEGHVKGDAIIKEFADSISRNKRKEDFFGRWGGDEFVLIAPTLNFGELDSFFKEIYPKVIADMKKVIPYSSFCFGIAEYSRDEDDYQQLITRADDKLYECKRRLKKGKMFVN